MFLLGCTKKYSINCAWICFPTLFGFEREPLIWKDLRYLWLHFDMAGMLQIFVLSQIEHIKNNHITIWVTGVKDHIFNMEFQANKVWEGLTPPF